MSFFIRVLCKMATASCINHYAVCIMVAYHVNVCKILNTFIMPILFKAESWFQSSTKAMENSTAMSQQCTTSVYCQYDTYHCFPDNTYPQQTQHCSVLLLSVFPHRHLITTQKIMCSLKSSHRGCKF